MSLVRTSDRLDQIVRDTLVPLCDPDDQFEYEVFIEAGTEEPEEGEDAPVCEGCGEPHVLVLYALFSLALIRPAENPNLRIRVTEILPITDADDDDEVRSTVTGMWESLCFQRQAISMEDIDQTG